MKLAYCRFDPADGFYWSDLHSVAGRSFFVAGSAACALALRSPARNCGE